MRKDAEIYEKLLAGVESKFEAGDLNEDEYKTLKVKYQAKLDAIHAGKDSDSITGKGDSRNNPMRILGGGTLKGGRYDRPIIVTGSLRTKADISALDMKIAGSLNAAGNILLEGDLKCSGSARLDGTLTAHSIRVAGSIKAVDKLKASDDMKCTGSTTVSKGGIEAGNDIKLTGGFNIQGDILGGRSVILEPKGTCVIHGDVGAEVIGVQTRDRRGIEATEAPGMRALKKLIQIASSSDQRIDIHGSVVADEILLLNTTVHGSVDGTSIVLGSGCVIKGEIHYRDMIEVDENTELAHQPIKVSK